MMDTLPISRFSVSPSQPAAAATDVANSETGGFDQALQQQMQPQAAKSAENQPQTTQNDTEIHSGSTNIDEDDADADTESVADAVTSLIAASTELQGGQAPVVTTETLVTEPLLADVLPVVMASSGIMIEQTLPQGGKSLPQVDMTLMTAVTADDPAVDISQAALINQVNVDDNQIENDLLQTGISMQDMENILPAAELKLVLKSTTAGSEQLNAVLNGIGKIQTPVTQQVVAVNPASGMNLDMQSFSTSSLNVLQSTSSGLNGAIATPVSHPNWGQGVGEQLALMVQGNLQTAEIKLNPAHLGPMEIRLSLNHDQASVTFISAHAAVRDALDAAMPRLRDMLEQQGINLANVDVSAQSGGHQQTPDDRPTSFASGQSAFGIDKHDESQPANVQRVIKLESGLSLYV
jgi:flagellar hook-length control protein FliK